MKRSCHTLATVTSVASMFHWRWRIPPKRDDYAGETTGRVDKCLIHGRALLACWQAEGWRALVFQNMVTVVGARRAAEAELDICMARNEGL